MPADQPGGTPSPAEIAQEISRARGLMSQAASAAKRRGLLPSHLASVVDGALAPQIDWREKLADWCTDLAVSDYSWKRPHRGYLVEWDIYAPSAQERTMGELVVASDISGSVSDGEFRQFAGELSAVHATLRPAKLHALQFTTLVARHDEYEPDDQLKLGKRHGSGGTTGQAVFDYLAEKGIEPVGVVDVDGSGDRAGERSRLSRAVGFDRPARYSPDFGERVDLI